MGAPGRVEDDTSGTCWASPDPPASPRPPAPPTGPAPPPRGLWMQHCPENSRQIFSTASRTTWSLNCTKTSLEEELDLVPGQRLVAGCWCYLLHVGGEPGRGRLVFFFGALYLFHDHLDRKTRERGQEDLHPVEHI